ncbi:MAG: hypothetical protein V1793_00580 [Pseudomonadota bacterium]
MTLWYRSIQPGTQWVKLLMIKTMMVVFGRALHAASRRDPDIRHEVRIWPTGFTILLKVNPDGPSLGFEKTVSGLACRGKDLKSADLELHFRNLDCAHRVLASRLGLHQAMADNRMCIRGDIKGAVAFARIMALMMACLFPGSVSRTGSSRFDGTGKKRTGLRIWLFSFGILLGK